MSADRSAIEQQRHKCANVLSRVQHFVWNAWRTFTGAISAGWIFLGDILRATYVHQSAEAKEKSV
jgi:hypothetical protein